MRFFSVTRRFLLLPCLAFPLMGCDRLWNNPHESVIEGETVLYSAFGERPKHLDPARSYSSDEFRFIAQIYEPPLQYDYLKRPYTLAPLSAASLPQKLRLDVDGKPLPDIASDEAMVFTEYRIDIRPGQRYQPHPAFIGSAEKQGDISDVYALSDFSRHSSRELVADDFVHQIKRLADPQVQSPIYGLMAEYIVGLKDLHERLKAKSTRRAGDLEDETVTGVTSLGRYQYSIRLYGDYPQFPYWLAMPFFAPLPPEAERFYDHDTLRERNISLDWYPLGSGPYMLSENNPNRRMTLVRNPNYPSRPNPVDPAGPLMPQIDRAVYALEKESIPRWTKFLQGYYDISPIGSDTFDQALQMGAGGGLDLTEEMRERGIELSSTVAATTYYFGFNWLDAVVGGDSERARSLRQAITIAVDFDEYVEIFRNGRGRAGQGPLPPGVFGYRDGIEGFNPVVYRLEGDAVSRYSLDKARALMEKAGYPEGINPATGKPLVLYYDAFGGNDPEAKARYAWYVKQFRKLGIQLVVRSTDYNRFREKMSKGTAQIYFWGWGADYPDPENFLFLLTSKQSKVEHGGENASNYSNPRFDALFERVKSMPNGSERQALIDEMVLLLREDAPWLWGFHPTEYTLRHRWISGLQSHAMANNTLKYRRLDTEVREQARQAWNRPALWPLGSLVALLIIAIAWGIFSWRRRELGEGRVMSG